MGVPTHRVGCGAKRRRVRGQRVCSNKQQLKQYKQINGNNPLKRVRGQRGFRRPCNESINVKMVKYSHWGWGLAVWPLEKVPQAWSREAPRPLGYK